jgi:predicted ATPase
MEKATTRTAKTRSEHVKVYRAQILLATHSPVILSLAKPDQVLCFNRTALRATDIVLGSEHPRLRTWRGETDLGTLFASGVLG